MGKVRRGGYVFLTWKGDHTPRHVHVYRDGRLVVLTRAHCEDPQGRGKQELVSLLQILDCSIELVVTDKEAVA